MGKRRPARPARWDATRVQALRRHLGLSQAAMAERLGTRQQTVSDWETGAYGPGGISSTLLGILAERADFPYEARPPLSPPRPVGGRLAQEEGRGPQTEGG